MYETITLLAVLSMASERLTDLIKNKLSFLEKPAEGVVSKMSPRTRELVL